MTNHIEDYEAMLLTVYRAEGSVQAAVEIVEYMRENDKHSTKPTDLAAYRREIDLRKALGWI